MQNRQLRPFPKFFEPSRALGFVGLPLGFHFLGFRDGPGFTACFAALFQYKN